MKAIIDSILTKENLTRDDIITLLSIKDEDEQKKLFKYAYLIKEKYIGKKVWLRGLIEYSNFCRKNCYYCGIRNGNNNFNRYVVPDEELFEAVDFAYKNHYGSIVIQSGEKNDKKFINHIDFLIKEIKKQTNNEIGITLSCGEQTIETYRKWFESGAHRYLLRIEASDKNLYNKIHPADKTHNFENRLNALYNLKKTGYQTGTGVMIGLPFQSVENLADDLLFFKKMDIDMIGMGPYIEHKETPLYKFKDSLSDKNQRLIITLKMIAILRIMMKDVNIASTTALQAIDNLGREKALKAGANIIMPNITPAKYKENYLLYENKPCISENAVECTGCLNTRINLIGEEIQYSQWGDSKHFEKRKQIKT